MGKAVPWHVEQGDHSVRHQKRNGLLSYMDTCWYFDSLDAVNTNDGIMVDVIAGQDTLL